MRALSECQLLQFPKTCLRLTEADVQREYARMMLPMIPLFGGLPSYLPTFLPSYRRYARMMLPMIPLFGGLDATTLEQLLSVTRYKDFPEG